VVPCTEGGNADGIGPEESSNISSGISFAGADGRCGRRNLAAGFKFDSGAGFILVAWSTFQLALLDFVLCHILAVAVDGIAAATALVDVVLPCDSVGGIAAADIILIMPAVS